MPFVYSPQQNWKGVFVCLVCFQSGLGVFAFSLSTKSHSSFNPFQAGFTQMALLKATNVFHAVYSLQGSLLCLPQLPFLNRCYYTLLLGSTFSQPLLLPSSCLLQSENN